MKLDTTGTGCELKIDAGDGLAGRGLSDTGGFGDFVRLGRGASSAALFDFDTFTKSGGRGASVPPGDSGDSLALEVSSLPGFGVAEGSDVKGELSGFDGVVDVSCVEKGALDVAEDDEESPRG
jgi:hypothetical protein